MSYTYWLLRYVPDPLRGEFVNIGVLVGNDDADWAIRRVRSFRRASRLGGDASRAEAWLRDMERQIHDFQSPPLDVFRDKGQRPPSGAQVQQLQRRLNNSIQISDPTPVEGTTAGDAADFLYSFLVVEANVPARSSTRRRLVSHLRDQYVELGHLDLGKNLERSPRAEVGRQRGRFDFAVVNEHVNQLSQVWSFDISDAERLEQDIQAWSFLVTRLRDSGGHLTSKSGKRKDVIAADVPISAVYQLPRRPKAQPEQMDVFFAAQEAWESLEVRAVPSTEMGSVATEARIFVSS